MTSWSFIQISNALISPNKQILLHYCEDVREVTMRGVCLYTIKPGNPGSFQKLHTLANSMYEQIQKRNKQKKSKHKRVKKKMFYNCSGSITNGRLRIDQPGIKCDFYFTGTAKFGFLIIKLPIAF